MLVNGLTSRPIALMPLVFPLKKDKKGRNRSRVPRQLPRPHLREKKAVVTSVFEQDCTSLRFEKLTASFHRRMILDERQSTEDTSVPFSRMYLDTLRSNFALTGVPGPLDIFLPEYRRLCAKWLITARHVDWEMVEQKCKTQFLAPKLTGLKSLLHKKAQKALLEKRLRQYLFWKQLPARRIHAKAPDATCRDALRAVVFRCINTFSSWTTSEKALDPLTSSHPYCKNDVLQRSLESRALRAVRKYVCGI